MVFGHNRATFMSSGAGFMVLGKRETAMRMTFGAPCPNPGKVNNMAISKAASSMGIAASGQNGIGYGFDMRNVNVSTRIFVALAGKNGGTAIAVGPGFGSGALALDNGLIPLGRSSMFGNHS